MLVVLVIMGVVGAITMTSIVKALHSTRQTQARSEALADVEKGLQRMSREIRAAHPVTLGSVTYSPIARAAANEIQVRILRKNPAGVDRSYAFTYRYTGGQIGETRRESAPGTDPVTAAVTYGPDARFVELVSNPATLPMFMYYDANGAQLALSATCTTAAGSVACLSADDTRRVARVRVTVSRTVPERSSPLTVSTLVSLRNNVR